MLRKFIEILLIVISCLMFSSIVFGHGRNEHDDEIEYVLFGDRYYADSHPQVKDIIQALEDAAFLCVDQFNGNGTQELANLVSRKVPNLPKSISEIDFSSNYFHRYYTHRGWNIDSGEKAHWPLRQSILLNTVEKELFCENRDLISHITGFFGSGDRNKEKIESFSILLYYVHIIGDHLEADKYSALAYIAPLTRVHDTENPGVIPELIQCCRKLFKSQENSRQFISFIQEMEDLQNTSDSMVGSVGGVNTAEKFSIYHQCADDLLETLSIYIPQLLQNEDFFRNVFFPSK